MSKRLTPHVRELKLIAGTGCGKTMFAANLAAPAAKKILERCVGETNSTIIERLIVFTTDVEQKDKMTVAVKRNSNAIPNSAFQEILTAAMATVIQKGRSTEPDEEKADVAMREALERELGKKNNLKAVLSLLPVKAREKFICDVTEWYRKFHLWDENAKLYNTAKNLSQEQKPGKTSISLLGLLKTLVREWFDRRSKEQQDEFQKIYNGINEKFEQHFFKVFFEDSQSEDSHEVPQSEDGYYYRDLTIGPAEFNDSDEKFCKHMFSSNNVQGGTLSLEVLCSEIVIYVPMHEKIVELLNSNPAAEKVFGDPRGNLVFGLRDTQGIFHADREEDQNVEYCSDLVYKNIPDAILVIIPLCSDQNGRKSQELYRHILQDYQKDTPIFLLHNKLDLFVDALIKNQDEFDAMTGKLDGETTELMLKEVNDEIKDKIKGLDKDLCDIQRKNGKKLNICSTAYYLKALNGALSPEVQKGIAEDYNFLKACKRIFYKLAEDLVQNAKKITVVPNPDEEQTLSVDKGKLRELLRTYLSSAETQTTVLTPGTLNIEANRGITPHGNSYHALGRRLRHGDSYSSDHFTFFNSDIAEGYYYNCKNINITFPANIKNLLSPQFLHTLVPETLALAGGTFKDNNGKEEFLKAVEMELCKEQYKRELVRRLLYHGAFLKDSNSMAVFSFRQKFQDFLDKSLLFLAPAEVKVRCEKARCEKVLDDYDKVLDDKALDDYGKALVEALKDYKKALDDYDKALDDKALEEKALDDKALEEKARYVNALYERALKDYEKALYERDLEDDERDLNEKALKVKALYKRNLENYKRALDEKAHDEEAFNNYAEAFRALVEEAGYTVMSRYIVIL